MVGHPLFDTLTEEKIEAEIKQWAFEYFKLVLASTAPLIIENVLEEYYSENKEEEMAKSSILMSWNILIFPVRKKMNFWYTLQKNTVTNLAIILHLE